jgi:hypothetical protein
VPGSARHQNVCPGAGRDLLLADGEGELAVEHVEGLFHLLVDVRHRPRARAAGELGEGEGASGVPAGWRSVVVRFELRDRPRDNYWLLLRKPTPELWTKGTGYVEDIIARTDAACLIDVHLKRTSDLDPAQPVRRLRSRPALASLTAVWRRGAGQVVFR